VGNDDRSLEDRADARHVAVPTAAVTMKATRAIDVPSIGARPGYADVEVEVELNRTA